MRRKNRTKGASQGAVEKKAFTCSKTKGSPLLGGMKQQDDLSKNPGGKGLGKAGAKRLGRLLKRAIGPQQEPAGKARASLPKTPVRLFKHQIETKANKAPKTEPPKQQVSQLILRVVSRCKHTGGISMAELKQTLAAQGYAVAKNNRHVRFVTEGLVKDETLERSTRNTTFRLSNKKVVKVKAVKMSTATSPEPTREVKAASKSREGAAESQKKKKMRKARGRTQKLKANTSKAAAKAQKKKTTGNETQRKIPQTNQKETSAHKEPHRSGKKPPAKVRSTQRNQPKRQVTASPRRQPRRGRLPKTRSRVQTQRRRNTRRTRKR